MSFLTEEILLWMVVLSGAWVATFAFIVLAGKVWTMIKPRIRAAGELLLGIGALIVFIFFPGRMFPREDEEEGYWPRDLLVIPHGAIAAAIASRWRPLEPGEDVFGRAAKFAHASAGGTTALH